jgi:hypothetical protein
MNLYKYTLRGPNVHEAVMLFSIHGLAEFSCKAMATGVSR